MCLASSVLTRSAKEAQLAWRCSSARLVALLSRVCCSLVCRVKRSLSSDSPLRSSWNSAHLFQPGGHIGTPNHCIHLITVKGHSMREGPLQQPCNSCRLQSSLPDQPCRHGASATILTVILVIGLILLSALVDIPSSPSDTSTTVVPHQYRITYV